MKFIIDQKVLDQFPDVAIGVVIAKDVDNSKTFLPSHSGEAKLSPESDIGGSWSGQDDIQKMLRVEEKRIREYFGLETLSQNPKIAVWRDAYKKFGAKSEYRSSVENLYRLVLKGIELRRINPLVDLYNYISLKYMLPVGGEDLDKIVGDLQLTYADGSEPPGLLLGESEPRAAHPGEVIYKDNEGIICRRWNWKEADRTKLTGETTNAVLVIEGLGEGTKDVEAATKELADLVSKFTGGIVASAVILTITNSTMTLRD